MEEDILDSHLSRFNPTDFRFYRDFHQISDAKEMALLLQQTSIPYSFETTSTIIDKAIVGEGLLPKVVLKLRPEDFRQVNELILSQVRDIPYSDLGAHYLIEFSDEELIDIQKNQNLWNLEDVAIAQTILKYRKVDFNVKELDSLRTEKLAILRKGKRGNRLWMFVYVLAMILGIITSLFFVLAGIGMSYYYAYGKDTDADGNEYYVFDSASRRIGVFMLFAGITAMILEIVFYVWYS